MIKQNDYVAYFKSKAEKNIDIAHVDETHESFRAINMDDLINGLNQPQVFPCMLLEKSSGSFRGLNFGNIIQRPDCAFAILFQVEDENYTQEEDAYNDAFEIGMEIISKMAEDHEANSNTIARLFEPENGIQYDNVGPVYDNCYGVRFQFSLSKSIRLKSNPSKWL
ncbi:MAG: hypothetical protein L6Q78_10920 [Bacteroidia bacterium]|nr:hypothetical protein [Bacteroidia bacterium]